MDKIRNSCKGTFKHGKKYGKLGQNGSYKHKWNFHIVLDELGKVIDSFPLGVWTK